MKSVKEATVSSAKWAAVERLSVQGTRFVIGIIMARLLSPADYGQVGMITFFIALSDTLVDSGFTNALIRKRNHTPEDFSTVFYFNFAIAVGCYAILFLISPWVANFFNMPILKSLLRVQSLSVLINSLAAVQLTQLTIALNFKAIAKCNFIASLVSGIFGIIMAHNGLGVWSLVFQTLMACIVTLVCVCCVCHWLPTAGFSKESFSNMFSYGSKLLASSIINRLYQNLTTLIIGKFYSPAALGLYDRGASIAALSADNINSVMEKITFPIMAKLQDDDVRLMIVQRKYIKLLSLVIFFICIFMAAIAAPFINILLTSKWAGAVIFMQIYTFAVCIKHMDVINLNLLFVKGRSDLVLKLEFIKKSLSVLILFASIPFGVVAICLARVSYSIITFISDSYYTGKYYNYGFIKQIKDIAPYFILSCVASAPAYALSFTSLNSFLVIIIGSCTALSIYYLSLRHDDAMVELLDILKSSILRQFYNKN